MTQYYQDPLTFDPSLAIASIDSADALSQISTHVTVRYCVSSLTVLSARENGKEHTSICTRVVM